MQIEPAGVRACLRAAALAEGETSRYLFPSRGRTGHLTRQRFAQPRHSSEPDVHQELTLDRPTESFLDIEELRVVIAPGDAVANLAQKASDQPVNTFTLTFEERELSEGERARAIAEAIGTRMPRTRSVVECPLAPIPTITPAAPVRIRCSAVW